MIALGAGLVLLSGVAAALALAADTRQAESAPPRLVAMYQVPPRAAPAQTSMASATSFVSPPQAGGARVADASLGLPRPEAATAASDVSACAGELWQQRRGEAALAQLRSVGATRALPVRFRPARADVLGMADLNARSVDVYVRSCDVQSDELLRHVVAHELGHLLDELTLDGQQRAAWLAVRGIAADTPWYGCSACNDFATPAGDFAEVYAQWARGAASNKSELAGAPGSAELAALANEFFGA